MLRVRLHDRDYLDLASMRSGLDRHVGMPSFRAEWVYCRIPIGSSLTVSA